MRGGLDDAVVLEAVVPVAKEYGLPQAGLKPCIAYHLDGNLPYGIARHNVAFTLAVELRELTDADEPTMRCALTRWARKIGYSERDAARAIRSALRKQQGEWKYKRPGLVKRPGSPYAETLSPICEAVGCPANCSRYRDVYVGMPSETFQMFERQGWADVFRRRRQYGALAVYRALCAREKQLSFSPGVRLFVSYQQLAALAGCDKRTVGRELRRLSELGLITFVPGFRAASNGGKHASEVTRTTPIPTVELSHATQVSNPHNHWVASRTKYLGGAGAPHLGGARRRDT